jgi:acyl-CoA synthetase (AMP-forming)/AMP-acid ligase II
MNLFAAVHATAVSARLVDGVEDATHAHLTPWVLARALDDGLPLGDVTVVVAGERLSPRLHDRAAGAGARVHHYYGAAELSFVAWGAHAEDLRPFPDVHVTVHDGEIWVRSPFVCFGYDGPAGPLRIHDGEATVGDRGVLSPGGRLTVTGRPDAVGVGGATVQLADVEQVLGPRARGELCVVGSPHPELGQVVTAVLTDAVDLEPLRAAARADLVGAARPRLWVHLPDLPTTPAGKVDRAAVAALLAEEDGRARRLV